MHYGSGTLRLPPGCPGLPHFHADQGDSRTARPCTEPGPAADTLPPGKEGPESVRLPCRFRTTCPLSTPPANAGRPGAGPTPPRRRVPASTANARPPPDSPAPDAPPSRRGLSAERWFRPAGRSHAPSRLERPFWRVVSAALKSTLSSPDPGPLPEGPGFPMAVLFRSAGRTPST